MVKQLAAAMVSKFRCATEGGLDVQLLDMSAAHELVADYLAQGTYESAALKLAGGMAREGREVIGLRR